MSAAEVKRYSAAEYLAFERKSDTKHEFYRGELFAMSGDTASHNLIATNLAAELRNALRERPCRTFTSDLRIVCPTGLYTYPDVSVVCGKVEYQDGTQDVLLNPLVLIEVLSPSTEAYDRGTKFKHYQSIESLREFVLVSQEEARVEHFARRPDSAQWTLTTIGEMHGAVSFPALDCSIPMGEVYAKVELGPEPSIHEDGGGHSPDH